MKNIDISKLPVSKKGDKFWEGEELTVLSFIGSDGNDYDTLVECMKAHPGKEVFVRNVEYGGTSYLTAIKKSKK